MVASAALSVEVVALSYVIEYSLYRGSHGQRGDHQSSRCRGAHIRAAKAVTGGNKTELVATAVRRLLDDAARTKPVFGAHPGSVKIRSDIDITQPVIDPRTDAESGREICR
jgi:hypothetical protein